MSTDTGRLERYAPLTGFIAVALWILGVFLLEKDDRPDGKDTAAFVAWVEENDTSILAGAIIFGFGVLFFLWLLGSLRTALIKRLRQSSKIEVNEELLRPPAQQQAGL